MKYAITLLLFIVAVSCGTTSKLMNQTVFESNMNQEILLGKINKSGMEGNSYGLWFLPNYNDYTVKTNFTNQITKEMLKDVDTKIVLATWCGDSHREVPRFYKIMETLSYSEKKMEVWAVDRNKKIEGVDLEKYNIKRVPTFIFYKNGTEIGRIIESPTKSLEEDLLEILSKKN